jgi:hypothetical protein
VFLRFNSHFFLTLMVSAFVNGEYKLIRTASSERNSLVYSKKVQATWWISMLNGDAWAGQTWYISDINVKMKDHEEVYILGYLEFLKGGLHCTHYYYTSNLFV